MPDRHTSPTAERSPKRSSADVDLLVPEWRQAMDLLERATESSLEELGSLREQLAGSLRSMRETRYWDAARSEEAVERLTTSLQAAERRLAEQAEGLGERQADAMEYAATIAQRLASALERLSPGKGGAGAPIDLDQLVADVRAAVARDMGGVSRKLASSVAKRLGEIEGRLGQATSEAASAGQEAAEKALDEVRTSFGELRDSLEELRAINEESRRAADDASAPVRQALEDLKGSLGEMSSAVGRDLAERVTELRTGQAAVERLAESMHGEVQGIGDRFRELVDERLSERVAAPLSAFAERLTALEGRMDQALGERLAQVEQTLAQAFSEAVSSDREAAESSFQDVHVRLAEVEGAATSASASVQREVETLRESIHKIASSAGREVVDLRSRVAALAEQAQRLSGIEEVVGGRLVELGQDVQAKLDQLTKDLEERGAPVREGLAALRDSLGGLESSLGSRIHGVLEGLNAATATLQGRADTLGEQIGMGLQAVETRFDGLLEERLSTLEERMASSSGPLLAGLDERVGALTREIAGIREGLTGDLAAARDSLASEVQTARQGLTGNLAAARDSLASEVQTARQGLTGDLAAARDGIAVQIRAIREELGQQVAAVSEALASELGAMGQRFADDLASLGDGLAARVSAIGERIPGEVGMLLEASEGRTAARLVDGIAGLETRLSSSTERLIGELAGEIARRHEQTEARLGEWVAAADARSASRIEDLEHRLSDRFAAMEVEDARREDALQGRDQGLRSSLAALHQASEAGSARVDAAVAATAEEIRALGARLEAETASLHQELAAERDRMASATKRVDRVADVIESLGRRRGFRELVATEQAMQQEQTAFVERLSATAERLGSALREAETRIGGAIASAAGALPDPETKEALKRLATTVAGLEEQLPAAIVAMAMDVRAELQRADEAKEGLAEVREAVDARLSGMEGSVGERLAGLEAKLARFTSRRGDGQESRTATRKVTEATAALRAEVKALRSTIQSWGKPRTAPRLAKEVSDLGERFEALERAVQETLATSVARKVHASVDRRLRAALAQISEQTPRDLPGEVEAINGPVAPAEPTNGPPVPREAPPERTPAGRRRRFRR